MARRGRLQCAGKGARPASVKAAETPRWDSALLLLLRRWASAVGRRRTLVRAHWDCRRAWRQSSKIYSEFG
ncbi:hypothetical protein HYPSUDRAFT_38007 [Hypholoma sublateritium FD-334 SS-4]|uniref:Uncharacterized protein n=1 Tax=Hypholoma sublateritium (strain FD-334 SS-4) TaxID=945553 RepID=A0A0D2Q0G6_HYPSF|nr:hypothetical protein HYPSUDRAFT_38007 [Hypholoma sublateritium FD-334 SS-4]